MNYQERVLELANKLENYSPEEITDTPLEELLSFLPFLEEIVQDTNPTPNMDGGLENAFQVIQGFYQAGFQGFHHLASDHSGCADHCDDFITHRSVLFSYSCPVVSLSVLQRISGQGERG